MINSRVILMLCCVNCFADDEIRSYINQKGAESDEKCPFCGSIKNKCIETEKIKKAYFDDFLDSEIFRGVTRGTAGAAPLFDICQKEWSIINRRMPISRQHHLWNELADESYSSGSYVIAEEISEAKHNWESHMRQLCEQYRFFFDYRLDDKLDEIRSCVETPHVEVNLKKGDCWYRSRLQKGKIQFKEAEMMAPPEGSASAGRCNPVGMSYLYLSEDAETCISEIRPHKSALLTVATFVLEENIRCVDLSASTLSPFCPSYPYDPQAQKWLRILSLMRDLIKQAVRPEEREVEYLKTQYICELFKKMNYDGVIFQSVYTKKKNLTLFKPNKARIVSGSLSTYQVDSCVIRSSKCIS